MSTETAPDPIASAASPAAATALVAKIFGVGTAGVRLLERMRQGEFEGAKLVAVDTEAAAVGAVAAFAEALLLETRPLRGLGTGGDPERGRAAAEENLQKLKDACRGVDIVCIVAGLGGGSGTGISPVLAQVARESGALTLAFALLPFDCEGNRRLRQAREGLEALRAAADGVICLPCQKLFGVVGENASVVEAFAAVSHVWLDGLRGVWRLVARPGLIPIHFGELSALLRGRHADSCFATAEAAGTTRSRDVIEKLFAHPLLDGGAGLREADAALVSLLGGPDLTMVEVHRVMEQISEQCPRAQIVMGAAVDETHRERLAVTLIATRPCPTPKTEPARARPARNPSPRSDNATLEFDSDFLHPVETPRPPARLVPPAPPLSAEEREQLLARTAAREAAGRKRAPRMRQTQLPLEIVSKGRFDRTEPTVHQGEDLDLPTFLRRGVKLN
ncbi:MAG: cell division protein FtsZ [Verrucomicrobiales bacterium]|nr:cell division protein FtsZ [Verrucomicrobiales bacterium]